jgi:hypothetical protein
LLIGSCIVLGAFAGILGLFLWPSTQTFYTDADTIDQSTAVAKIRDILWQPPIRLPNSINSAAHTYEPRLSADGMTLYLVLGKAGGNADIHYCTRTPEGWSNTKPLAELNTEYDDLGPEPSADGRSLYFYSDRPGGFGGYDLWVAHRGLDGRSELAEPINLGPSVNSEFNDYGPALVPGGEALYFASNRPQAIDTDKPDPDAWPGTIREDLYHRTYDLYVAPITEQGVGKAKATNELNTPYNEGAPAVSPVGDFLYFASDRPGGEGAFDLYRSRRLSGACEPPTNLGITVNTPANELDPGLTLGGYALYFSSNRAVEGVSEDPEKSNAYNIYHTMSREVFTRAETRRTSIDWAALWSAIGPNLLLALLALLLLLLLLVLTRSLKSRKLSLLARCLLASLAAHLLLMLLFTAWKVTATLARELTGRGRIQIALVAPARGDDIISQVRGEFTSVDVPESPAVDVRRHTISVEAISTPSIEALAVGPGAIVVEDRLEMDRQVIDAEPERRFDLPDLKPSLSEVAVAESLELTLPAEEARANQSEVTSSVVPAAMPRRPVARPSVSRVVQQRISKTSAAQASLAPESNTPANPEQPRQSLADASSSQDAPTAPTTVVATNTAAPASREFGRTTPRSPTLQLAMPQAPRERLSRDEPEGSVSHASVRQIEPSRRTRLPKPETRTASSQLRELDPTPMRSTAEESSLAGTAEKKGSGYFYAQHPSSLSGKSSLTPFSLAELSLDALEESEPTEHSETVSELEGAPTSHARGSLSELVALAHKRPVTSFDLSPARHGPTSVGAETPLQYRSVPDDAELHAVSPEPPDATKSPNPLRATTALPSLNLHIPSEVAPPDRPYRQRSHDQRMNIVENMGGGEETEEAVQLALQWLAAHQSPDGRWDGDGFDEECGHCGGETDVEVDIALTGLSLLCFVAADHTHTKAGAYRDNVQRALQWLVHQQSQDGDLRRLETMYSQGIATIALAEAYGMTHDSRLQGPVQRAVHFIERARNRQTGIWRYDPGQPGDTSVLGWQIMALKSASAAGAEVSMESFFAARQWLDMVSSPTDPGLYAYQPRRAPTPAMTAEGLFIQLIVGRQPDEPHIQRSVAYILDHLPDWDDAPNTYYWYYATLALFHHQGDPWHRWNAEVSEQLLLHQRKQGRPAGSWDPHGKWAQVGGRVYQTALCTLTLEVYYRYLPLFLLDRPEDAIGTIRGTVTDAVTDAPLPDSVVRLNLADRAPVEVTTDIIGGYVLQTPEVPSFFALSASRDGYLPMSRNVATAMVRGNTLRLDFELQPETQSAVAVEAVPEVHHLGDNRFTGRINSQFQKQSEGSSFSATFLLASTQLPPHYSSAELTMLVKGIQLDHDIRVNDQLLRQRLDWSPRDGSFGEFRTDLDLTLLQAGTNTIDISANAIDNDIDDFEFVNMQIRLLP